MPRIFSAVGVAVAAFVMSLPLCNSAFSQQFDTYCNYLGRFPAGATNWSDDAQGVANDNDNWFITQTTVLWKIPVGHNLDSVESGDAGVIRRELASYGDLANYPHFGDPDVFQYDAANAYLVLPIEHHDQAEPGAIAILRCNDLSLVGFVELVNGDGEPTQGHDAGWCAVDAQGMVWSSMQHPGFGGGPSLLYRYAVDWERVHNNQGVSISLQEIHAMRNETNAPLDLTTMQGGDFGPGDQQLYLISGFHNDDGQLRQREGLHVLEMTQPFVWTRVEHSTNGSGHFNYYYNSDFTIRNEPEGLTIWDLNDGRAPNIRGFLHAFMSDNDLTDGDIYFYHYTHTLYVHAAASCNRDSCCTFPPSNPACSISGVPCHSGTNNCPFSTVAAAASNAWDGCRIEIRAGTYNESVSISKRVRLVATGGIVRIGS